MKERSTQRVKVHKGTPLLSDSFLGITVPDCFMSTPR